VEHSSKGIPREFRFCLDSTKGGNEEDSPFSVDKRSPSLEEEKRKAE